MTINFKKLSDKAVLPTRTAYSGAGFNLTAVGLSTEINERGQLVVIYHTGLAIDVPTGYEATLRPMPSIASKTLRMCDAPCAIKGDMTEEITARFISTTDVVPAAYKEGEQFAQLVINKVEDVEFVELVEPEKEYSAATGSQSPSEDKDKSINSETTNQPAAGENAPEEA